MTGYLIYGIHWGNLKLFLLQYLQIAANSFMQGNLWDEWCWSVFHSAPCYLFKFLERKVKWFTREEPEYRLGFTLICQLFKKQAWHLFGAISVPIVPLASVIPKFPIHFQVTKKNFLSWGFLVIWIHCPHSNWKDLQHYSAPSFRVQTPGGTTRQRKIEGTVSLW